MLLQRFTKQNLAALIAAMLLLADCGGLNPLKSPAEPQQGGRAAMPREVGAADVMMQNVPPVALTLFEQATASMAGGDFVNAGTRVTTRALDAESEEVYTFLGPWDTDVENKVLNYQAPLAMAFMGAKIGDTVTFGEEGDQRTWEILGIEPAV